MKADVRTAIAQLFGDQSAPPDGVDQGVGLVCGANNVCPSLACL